MKAIFSLQCLAAYHVSNFQKTESFPKQKTLARNLVSGRAIIEGDLIHG